MSACVCVRVCVCQALFLRVKIMSLDHSSQQGDHPCVVRDGPTKRPQHMRISRLITVTYLPSSIVWHNRLLSYLGLRLFRYLRLVMLVEKYLLPTLHFAVWATWLTSPCRPHGTHMDISVHHTSVSSVDFRKPLDGTAPGVIPASQGSKYGSAVAHFFPLCSFPFSLLCFSCFPVRTCTNSFYSGFRMSENVVIRIALCMTSRLKVQPASELATFGMV